MVQEEGGVQNCLVLQSDNCKGSRFTIGRLFYLVAGFCLKLSHQYYASTIHAYSYCMVFCSHSCTIHRYYIYHGYALLNVQKVTISLTGSCVT